MEKSKRRFGDRRDKTLLRDLDPMHFIVPQIHPNRCDNEAYLSERIDLGPVNAYLEKKNAAETEFPYTLFHVILVGLLKTITLRPKMNRFIANKNVYQRNGVTAAFVVKKRFADDGEEALAIVGAAEDDTIGSVHAEIFRQITACRSDVADPSSDSMELFNKMPRFLAKSIVWVVTKLDKHGKCPAFLVASDPYYASVLLSNVGSIGLKSGYHHLTNWGTNSVFCLIGEKKRAPFYDAEGNVAMRETVDLGLTIDERLADGYYYAGTVRLFKRLMEEPELLEKPLGEKVEY
ncbi:MAG TPA: 2-oxo acid dehydrogenase subunit E2 [Oscillospiraceae bacterium]|nr:2-oxo acid dehydrogenase subunit E2 [Oscillospiraceae bacterium]